MARVDVTLNGRSFPVACDDGQEGRVREIAGYIDSRLAEIRAAAPGATDLHLMVMVSLLIGDELMDVRSELDEALAGRSAATPPGNGAALDDGTAAELSSALAHVAGRLEAIAARVERP